MATASSLIKELSDMAQVEPGSEAELHRKLPVYLKRALSQHNSQYTYETLPVKEEECVLLLAQMRVCFFRASEHAKEANVSGGHGFGSDRNTPYYKQMDLAKQIGERYKSLVASLGVSSTTAEGQVVQGRLRVRDALTDSMLPQVASEEIGTISLSTVSSAAGTVVLAFEYAAFDNFSGLFVFSLDDDEEVYQGWNLDSATGVPYINDGAVKLLDSNSATLRQVKIVGVTPPTSFIVVVRTRGSNYAYSNVVTVAS